MEFDVKILEVKCHLFTKPVHISCAGPLIWTSCGVKRTVAIHYDILCSHKNALYSNQGHCNQDFLVSTPRISSEISNLINSSVKNVTKIPKSSFWQSADHPISMATYNSPSAGIEGGRFRSWTWATSRSKNSTTGFTLTSLFLARSRVADNLKKSFNMYAAHHLNADY